MKVPGSVFAALCAFSLHAIAGTFTEEFGKLKAEGKPEALRDFVLKSYDTEKADPDYFALAANYWWNLNEGVTISARASKPGSFSVRDPKTGKEVGSIAAGEKDPKNQRRALDLVREGFEKFPNRLDIGMGLAFVQKELGLPDECVETLEKVLERARRAPDSFLWTNNRPLPKPPAEFIPESMQGYTTGFYQSGTRADFKRCKDLCEALILTFPDHPYAYNVMAGVSQAENDDKACLKYLETAHEKAPKDAIVLLNLADAYRRAGNKSKALQSYQAVKESDGSDEMKADAEKAIAALSAPATPAGKPKPKPKSAK